MNPQQQNIAGNYYPKFTSNNPIYRFLMENFLMAMDDFVQKAAPSSIHEVGCGEGYIISRYVEKGISLKGSDISEEIIELAKLKNKDLNNQILFVNRGIEKLDEGDKADLIICSEVLEHVEDPEKVLQILSKLASPYLIISVPNEPLWRVLNMLRGKYLRDFGNTPGHINHWSKKGIITLIDRFFIIEKAASAFPWTMLLCRTRG